MKQIKSRWKSKTPRVMIILGNIFLMISSTITGFAIYNDDKEMAMIALITGILGKLISLLFVETDFKKKVD